jgi:hypothetical protein
MKRIVKLFCGKDKRGRIHLVDPIGKWVVPRMGIRLATYPMTGTARSRLLSVALPSIVDDPSHDVEHLKIADHDRWRRTKDNDCWLLEIHRQASGASATPLL